MKSPRMATTRTGALALALGLAMAGCGSLATGGEGDDGGPAAGGGSGGTITMARATWDTGWFQAAIYAEMLDELGYDVTDPSQNTRDANGFYPALARGEFDLWANGWFPLHDRYRQGELVTGQTYDTEIQTVGTEVAGGAIQGYLIDKATADAEGITSMSDFADPDVAAIFDTDGNGLANLNGCNDGWGCNAEITDQIAELDWGPNVEQIVGDYPELIEDVEERVANGEPTLFYTWTPNWTVSRLVPGEDVVWLGSPTPADVEESTVADGLEGCAADPCELGWLVNDIQAVGNTEFLDDNPPVRRLLEVVEIPLDDIAAQNEKIAENPEYTNEQILEDARTWIEDNRDTVDGWLETARG